MSEWKQIPRKLRAALVQISSYGKPTISGDTARELVRRGWITEGNRNIYHVHHLAHPRPTGETYSGFVLTYEGYKALQLCPTFSEGWRKVVQA